MWRLFLVAVLAACCVRVRADGESSVLPSAPSGTFHFNSNSPLLEGLTIDYLSIAKYKLSRPESNATEHPVMVVTREDEDVMCRMIFDYDYEMKKATISESLFHKSVDKIVLLDNDFWTRCPLEDKYMLSQDGYYYGASVYPCAQFANATSIILVFQEDVIPGFSVHMHDGTWYKTFSYTEVVDESGSNSSYPEFIRGICPFYGGRAMDFEFISKALTAQEESEDPLYGSFTTMENLWHEAYQNDFVQIVFRFIFGTWCLIVAVIAAGGLGLQNQRHEEANVPKTVKLVLGGNTAVFTILGLYFYIEGYSFVGYFGQNIGHSMRPVFFATGTGLNLFLVDEWVGLMHAGGNLGGGKALRRAVQVFLYGLGGLLIFLDFLTMISFYFSLLSQDTLQDWLPRVCVAVTLFVCLIFFIGAFGILSILNRYANKANERLRRASMRLASKEQKSEVLKPQYLLHRMSKLFFFWTCINFAFCLVLYVGVIVHDPYARPTEHLIIFGTLIVIRSIIGLAQIFLICNESDMQNIPLYVCYMTNKVMLGVYTTMYVDDGQPQLSAGLSARSNRTQAEMEEVNERRAAGGSTAQVAPEPVANEEEAIKPT